MSVLISKLYNSEKIHMTSGDVSICKSDSSSISDKSSRCFGDVITGSINHVVGPNPTLKKIRFNDEIFYEDGNKENIAPLTYYNPY